MPKPRPSRRKQGLKIATPGGSSDFATARSPSTAAPAASRAKACACKSIASRMPSSARQSASVRIRSFMPAARASCEPIGDALEPLAQIRVVDREGDADVAVACRTEGDTGDGGDRLLGEQLLAKLERVTPASRDVDERIEGAGGNDREQAAPAEHLHHEVAAAAEH